MTRIAACLVVALAGGLTLGADQTPSKPPQAPPVFRTGIEIFHLDVSVVDKNRQPVRGLMAADFTLLEDGTPQKIVALSPIDIPDAEEPTATWMRGVTPDVTTNQLGDRRLFVIVMDDATAPPSPVALTNARKIARDVVGRLGPDDLAAVVFTRDNRHTQNFTSDHAKLLAAVDHYTLGFPQHGTFDLASIGTVADAAHFLIEIPERRKALVYVTFGVDIGNLGPVKMGGLLVNVDFTRAKQNRLIDIFHEAERANVNVYTYDVCGLRPPPTPLHDPCEYVGPLDDFIHEVADGTGGHATVNTNDFTQGITQMFRENSSYYLLGYESTSKKGPDSFRHLEVKVNRPGVEVRSRTMYYAEKAAPAPKPGSAPASPLTKSLAGLLPNPDMPLRVSVAPVAIPGRLDQAAVAIVLGVERPASVAPGATPAAPGAPSVTAGATLERLETMDLLVSAFDPEGRPRGSQQQTTRVTPQPHADGSARYELLARMDLKPGRYELRLSAHDATRDTNGSVYADVEVPDFAKAPLSLSGLMLEVNPALPGGPRNAFDGLLPVTPTSKRDFATTDQVGAFLQVHQGGATPLAPVALAIRIVNDHDATVFERTGSVGADLFPASLRSANQRFALPLSTLAPGAYLLTVEATLGKTTARRDVRFEVTR